MRSFSTVDLLRDLKSVTHAATREPVAITQHRKPRFVLMAMEDFERLADRPKEPRRAIKTDETPPEIAAIFGPALQAMIDGQDLDGDD